MRRSPGQSLRIDVAPQAVSVRRVSRWSAAGSGEVLATQAVAADAPSAVDAIAAALRTVLGELGAQRWPASFILADELTRMWRVTPPAGAARMADLEAAAGLRFQSLYGETASAWQVSADWNATAPFFAAAVPRALLAALDAVAQDCRLTIVAIEPRFVSAWNASRRALKAGAWFAHVHDNLLTLGAAEADGKGLRAIRALPIPDGADQSWLTQTLQREALLLDVAPPALLQVGGRAPAGWLRPAASPALIPCVALPGSVA